MYKIKKILAPTDLSNLSKAGVRCALEIAGSQGAEVVVYNVIAPEESPFPGALEEWVASQELPKVKRAVEERKRLLARFVRENFADLGAEIKVKQEVEIGVPYKRIVQKDGKLILISEKVDNGCFCRKVELITGAFAEIV